MSTDIQRPQVDLADVATVLELEAPLRTLLEKIAAAGPALDRLEAAGYPGADSSRSSLKWDLQELTANRRVGADRVPVCAALRSLERLRIGEGNQAALDYYEFMVEQRMEVGDACAELLDREDNADRLAAFIQYAKTQARA